MMLTKQRTTEELECIRDCSHLTRPVWAAMWFAIAMIVLVGFLMRIASNATHGGQSNGVAHIRVD